MKTQYVFRFEGAKWCVVEERKNRFRLQRIYSDGTGDDFGTYSSLATAKSDVYGFVPKER